MDIKTRWELSDAERHKVSIDLQRSEQEIKRLQKLDEVSARLHVWHESDPETISDLLGIEPDDVSRKGDSLTPEGRWDIRSPATSWVLCSEGKVKQDTVEAHLNWILNQVSGCLPNLRRLQDSGARTKIVLQADSWSRLQYMELSVETLLLLARYRLKLTVVVNYQNADADY